MKTYFHATYRENLASVQEKGLGGLDMPRNFEGSPPGVYLAEGPLFAVGILIEKVALEGFKTDKAGPAEYLESIVVLVIDGGRLPEDLLIRDGNIEREGFGRYPGIVDVTAMPVIDADMASLYSIGRRE